MKPTLEAISRRAAQNINKTSFQAIRYGEVIPKRHVPAYRTWYANNQELFHELGFDDNFMISYYGHCIRENKIIMPRGNHVSQ